ncbi:MAG: HTH domain-containing protein [Clostridia bacterium]|nr:HTH domain-containing protein [Clostridia bacterium]
MKDYLIFAIFMYLIKNKKTTAQSVAREFEISTRSVYRYIDSLSLLGVPIVTKIGKGGGIEVVGDFYLENLALPKSDKQILFEFAQRSDIPNNVKTILQKLIF